MNASATFLELRQFLWDRLHEAASVDQVAQSSRLMLSALTESMLFPVIASAIIVFLTFRFYQPRIARGSLWVPFFGIFGGTPTLYLHSRPASVGGVLLKTRHRTCTFRHHRKHE